MAIQAMNTAIKNNNLMRTKREKFKKTLGGYGKNKKTEYNFPKATTKQLKEIARRLKEERKIRMIKVVALTIILSLGLVYAILY